MTSTGMHWVSGHRAGAGRGTVPVQEAQAGSSLTESRGASGPSRVPLLHSTCTHTTCTQPPGPHVQSALRPWGSVPLTLPLLVLPPSPCPQDSGILPASRASLPSRPHCHVPASPRRTPCHLPGPRTEHKSARPLQPKVVPFMAPGTILPQLQHPEAPAVPGCSWPSHPRVPSSKATR